VSRGGWNRGFAPPSRRLCCHATLPFSPKKSNQQRKQSCSRRHASNHRARNGAPAEVGALQSRRSKCGRCDNNGGIARNAAARQRVINGEPALRHKQREVPVVTQACEGVRGGGGEQAPTSAPFRAAISPHLLNNRQRKGKRQGMHKRGPRVTTVKHVNPQRSGSHRRRRAHVATQRLLQLRAHCICKRALQQLNKGRLRALGQLDAYC
jgi:hypothetical protein